MTEGVGSCGVPPRLLVPALEPNNLRYLDASALCGFPIQLTTLKGENVPGIFGSYGKLYGANQPI